MDLGYKKLNFDTTPKWKDMRISYIPINLDDMRNIAYMPKLGAIQWLKRNINDRR